MRTVIRVLQYAQYVYPFSPTYHNRAYLKFDHTAGSSYNLEYLGIKC